MATLLHVFKTEMGWVAIMGSERRIAELRLPVASRRDALEEAREGKPGEYVESDSDFSGQAGLITAYFAGQPVEFDCSPDLSKGSDFDRRVWSATRDIHYGQVVSYGDLAKRAGVPGGSRAVGQSLGRNPVPVIVPCHRVVLASGELGGFGYGQTWKTLLLNLELDQSPYRRMDGEL